MSDPETNEIISLQERLIVRPNEVGARASARDNLARQFAHVAVLGSSFAGRSLPLFMAIESGHTNAIQTLLVSIKNDLEELRDAIQDLEPDLSDLIEILGKHLQK